MVYHPDLACTVATSLDRRGLSGCKRKGRLGLGSNDIRVGKQQSKTRAISVEEAVNDVVQCVESRENAGGALERRS